MDFAKRQLEKYGWCEGQGLGKHSSGITTALKPKVKLNTAGIGHDPAQEFTYHWWEDAFNNAASNINIEQTKEGVKVETVADDSPEISAVKRAKIKRDKMQYGAFIKRETLTKSGSVLAPEDKADPVEKGESRLPALPAALNDEELFQACGGLTAHKAARHGHKLSGKLQRVKEQEEAFLKALQNKQTKIESPAVSETTSPKLGIKKNRKNKNRDTNTFTNNEESICSQTLSNVWNDEGKLETYKIVKQEKVKRRKKSCSSQNVCEVVNTEENPDPGVQVISKLGKSEEETQSSDGVDMVKRKKKKIKN